MTDRERELVELLRETRDALEGVTNELIAAVEDLGDEDDLDPSRVPDLLRRIDAVLDAEPRP